MALGAWEARLAAKLAGRASQGLAGPARALVGPSLGSTVPPAKAAASGAERVKVVSAPSELAFDI